jgi:gliding motility-associated-like protein
VDSDSLVKTLQRILVLFVIFICSATTAFSSGIAFIQNRGQWKPDILFRAELPGGFLFLKDKSIVYVLYDRAQVAALHAGKKLLNGAARTSFSSQISAHGVEMKFENCNAEIEHTAKQPISTKYNYFLGNDPANWAGDVSAFEEVLYENVYAGIDLRIFMYQASLKYEFIVHPNADASAISLKYDGASDLALNKEGQTVISTSVGQFKEAQPYSYQVVNKSTIEVASRFNLSEGNRVRFELPKGYDKSQALTIDPELIFSTYSGSVSDNWGHTATYDDAGNLYSGGTVFGKDFPATVGAFQTKFAGLVDVGILKYNPDGTKLLYATFLGGASTDVPSSLIANSKGELLIYGTTSSKNFPVKGAYQPTFGGGVETEPVSGLDLPNGSDIFVSKLSVDGKQLLASTYLGGEGNDGASTEDNVVIRNYGDSFRGEIELDLNDNVLIASSTSSKKFPLKNATKSTLSGRQDGVVLRLSSGLNELLWSTYVGGNQYDAVFSVKLAKNGDAYITGITQSTDLPVHATAYQAKLNGTEDAFVSRYVNDKLSETTYLGTAKEDGAYLLDLDPSENVYIYGLTHGSYPVSAGVYSNAKSGQFIHALDPTLSKTIFSTVIGSGRGAPDISPTAFLVSECGNIYLAGWGGEVNVYTDNNTESSTKGLPITTDALQPTTNGNNFYIAILEQGAKSLLYATYFGNLNRSGFASGDHVDGGTSRFDKNGMIYHATCACGDSGFPTTPTAWSTVNNSNNCNNAAFKIDIDRLKADFDVYEGTVKDVVKGCAPMTLSFVNTSLGGIEYLWQIDGNTISREEEKAGYEFKTPGTYTVVLKAYNRLSCKREDVATKTIVVETLDAQIKGDTAVCENSSVRLWASGGTQYKWTPATGLDNPQSASPVVTVKETTEFLVEVSNATGCKVTKKMTITVQKKVDFAVMPDTEICAGTSAVLTVSGSAKEYHWHANGSFPATTGNSVTVKPTETTTYVVEGIYADGCRPVREVTVKIDQTFAPSFEIVRLEGSCSEAIKYTMSNKSPGSSRFEWDLGVGNIVNQTDVEGITYEKPGEYTVTLTSYNAAGCALSVSKTLVSEPPFVLANVITPNGDGKNDFFIVPVSNSHLEVFNRWGKKIFNAADYKNDWGKDIANGTYYYVVDTPSGNHCKGWVEVLE